MKRFLLIIFVILSTFLVGCISHKDNSSKTYQWKTYTDSTVSSTNGFENPRAESKNLLHVDMVQFFGKAETKEEIVNIAHEVCINYVIDPKTCETINFNVGAVPGKASASTKYILTDKGTKVEFITFNKSLLGATKQSIAGIAYHEMSHVFAVQWIKDYNEYLQVRKNAVAVFKGKNNKPLSEDLAYEAFTDCMAVSRLHITDISHKYYLSNIKIDYDKTGYPVTCDKWTKVLNVQP